ncbi:MAG: ABC transporter substrate-binding protein [Ilumatobacteraceae bacterium]
MAEQRIRGRLLALTAGASVAAVVAGACIADAPDASSDVMRPPSESAAETSLLDPAPTTAGATAVTAARAPSTVAVPQPPSTPIPEDPAAMVVTMDLAPSAVWQDGSPVTATDFECTWRANIGTPGAPRAADYARIVDVHAGATDRQVVVELDEIYSGYRTLFDAVIEASAVPDCDDATDAFATSPASSAGAYRVESWTADQVVLVANEHYQGPAPLTGRIVIVRQPSPASALAALRDGRVDVVLSAFDEALAPLRADPTLGTQVAPGYDVEGLYFQQDDGPLADPVLRAAVSMSIDRQALYADVFEPAFGAAGLPGGVLDCGPTVPGPWCPDGAFASSYDPIGAAVLLAEAGWVRDADGWWSKDGVVPELRWMVDEGNVRRERAQASAIPRLAAAGFRVVADNCGAACVFDQRLPALDYDIAMYTAEAGADPSYLTPWFTCEEVPGPQYGLDGQNVQGWCDEQASASLHEADRTLDPDARGALVRQAVGAMAADHVMLPLVVLPPFAAWRADRVGGPAAGLSADRGFSGLESWVDVDGDGQIVIGTDQWPACPNPVSVCADSTAFRWTIAGPALPSVWRPDPGGVFAPTALVTGEPQVATAG